MPTFSRTAGLPPAYDAAPQGAEQGADRGEVMRIGFVGTGTMGTPIAGCLMAAGHELVVYDVQPKAMEALAARYPDDDEAQIFYAITLNVAASPNDKTYANQLKGASLLEPIFKR